MPLKFNPIRGKPTQLALKHIGNATKAPSGVTIVVSGSGAAQGAKTIPVEALSAPIHRNTRLVFDNVGATDVVVTEFADEGATELTVESYRGAAGAGIRDALAEGDEAEWDGLHIDIASENLEFSTNPSTQELTATVHGSGDSITVSQSEVTSVAPQITRAGLLFDEDSPLIQELAEHSDDNSNWWAKLVIPNVNGEGFIVWEGLATVQDFTLPSPADNHATLSYTVRFKVRPEPVFLRDA